MESPDPVGAFFDVCPLSVMTTSRLAQLNELRPHALGSPTTAGLVMSFGLVMRHESYGAA
jgi:hypothetical protein